MRILLTGSNGLVGNNLLEHPDSNKFKWLAPNRAELNLLDYNEVFRYVGRNMPDMIIHAAGKVGGIHANINQPVAFLLENLDMGRNVVWAARQAGIKKLINLGSSCMYPKNAPNPLKEESILTGELEPTNEGYALAKLSVARLCEYINREDSAYSYKTLIPCNLYGRWDKFNPRQSHLIPAVIHKIHQAMISGIKVVDIWGDGTSRREFMNAADLADCLIHGIKHFDSMPPLMNVGTGIDHSINDFYNIIAKIIGFSGSFTHDLSKPVGMKQKIVSITKLSDWGWRSGIEMHEGLTLTYDFYIQHFASIAAGKIR